MEAESVEDKGEGVEFCVFVYNAQPGVTIDYATGDSWLDEMVREISRLLRRKQNSSGDRDPGRKTDSG